MADEPRQSRAQAVARYKAHLRECIDRRPSGLRARLARALGKNKSFISQISNPAYDVPIPERCFATIVEVCHLGPAEAQQFMALYRAAHPASGRRRGSVAPRAELTIALPQLRSPALAHDLEDLILEFAARAIRLAERADGSAATTPAATANPISELAHIATAREAPPP